MHAYRVKAYKRCVQVTTMLTRHQSALLGCDWTVHKLGKKLGVYNAGVELLTTS